MVIKNYVINKTRINIHDDNIPEAEEDLLLKEMLNNTCLNIIKNIKKQAQSD